MKSGYRRFVALSLFVAVLAGCSRQHYRRQADADAYSLVQQASCDPRWHLPGFTIEVHPESRMFDPDNPDCPPMPPDDPSSHQLMHCVDCKRGYPCWHANGDTPYVENPYWLSTLAVAEDGTVLLNEDSVIRLAFVHSPDFQEELEELYLSALDVSFERFRFDHQFFGGESVFYTADGRARNALDGESQSVLEVSTATPGRNWSMQKLYTTGAELVVGFANSLIWQFAGPDDYTSTTLLDFSLIQPLLRGAGRDFVMERLTIAERSLLANVRQMERFRRGFYLEILTGSDSGPGPSRRGGFFGGSGLEGFTGVGGGGFGRVGGFSGGGFGGQGFAAGAGAASAGGFFGLLQEQQGLRNQEATIAALRNSLSQLEAFYNAGRIDFLQVQQARQALFNAESQLLNAQAAFETNLDELKNDMGLPPSLEMTVDATLLKPFDLIDSQLVPIQNRMTDIQRSMGETILELANEIESGEGWSPQVEDQLRAIQGHLQEVADIQDEIIGRNLPRAEVDIQTLRGIIPRRVRQREWTEHGRRAVFPVVEPEGLELVTTHGANAFVLCSASKVGQVHAREEQPGGDTETVKEFPPTIRLCQVNEQGEPAASAVVNLDQLQQLPGILARMSTELSARVKASQAKVAEYLKTIDDLLASGPDLEPQVIAQRTRDDVVAPIPNELTELSAQVLELILLQARARAESITLVPVQLRSDEALEIARANRRDWMNARATLVDTWRLIQFNANSLESDLDIVFSGDIGNVGDNPFRLRSTTGRLRVGVEFDAPLTRLAERNTYRQALIEYQQARRTYYQFEDRISQRLRFILRTINANLRNFELRRAAVQVAIAQVELARLRLQEPPRPGEEAAFGATTARDLVSALSDLLDAQNFFLSVWINYEVLRRTLDFNLGTMELGPDGMWLDPGPLGVLGVDPEAGAGIPSDNPESMLDAELTVISAHAGAH